MNRMIRALILNVAWLIAISCILIGCTDAIVQEETYKKEVPAGLKYNVAELPEMSNFSDTEYEDYAFQFSSVQSAKLITGDKEMPISSDDPRLIRLLNFLAYGLSEGHTEWLQGLVLEDEINCYLACDDMMLDVTFHQEGSHDNSTHNTTNRMILCGDSYLLFTGHDLDGNVCGERFWPYAGLSRVRNDSTSFYAGEWGNDFWIDILTYAGF